MDFKQSETFLNLARAFAGESQARNRYMFYAERAKNDGLEYLSRRIKHIAKNEQAHAQVFFNHIIRSSGEPVSNINIDAGYPFEIADTCQNMSFAANGETAEHECIYPSFADKAKEEGFNAIEASFRLIATIEGAHSRFFKSVYDLLSSDSLYKQPSPVIWECSFCGHKHTGNNAPHVCPVCGKPVGWFIFPES